MVCILCKDRDFGCGRVVDYTAASIISIRPNTILNTEFALTLNQPRYSYYLGGDSHLAEDRVLAYATATDIELAC